jgi:hypothetical protein
MTRAFHITFLVVLLTASCNQVRGSGTLKEETRQIPAFTEIEFNGGYNFKLVIDTKAGDSLDLKLSGDDNLLELVKTTVTNDRLVVESDKNLSPDNPLTVTVSPSNLTVIEINGAADGEVAGLATKELKLTISGSGDIALAGEASKFTLDISGAGDVKAKDLTSKNVVVSIAGAGNAEVCTSDTLEVDIAGSGDVSYYCNPKTVKQDISGSGNLEKMSKQ